MTQRRGEYTIECCTCGVIHPLDEYEAEAGLCPECGTVVLYRRSSSRNHHYYPDPTEDGIARLVALLGDVVCEQRQGALV